MDEDGQWTKADHNSSPWVKNANARFFSWKVRTIDIYGFYEDNPDRMQLKFKQCVRPHNYLKDKCYKWFK